LPDLTFLARRDSQYGISILQWRFAELCELGLVAADRAGDDLRAAVTTDLSAVLRAIYSARPSGGGTGRNISTAEVERHVPPARISRRDLGWKSLLFASPSLPEAGDAEPVWNRSVVMPQQGLAVFRRPAQEVMLALDYGHHGGGHGHPDRLNVVLYQNGCRWLDDPGTGSYVDSSLFWYRSSLAHNAPMIDWRTQPQVHGALSSIEDRGADSFVEAQFHDPAVRATITRALAVMRDYAVDRLEWRGARAVSVQLPLHVAPVSVQSVAGADLKDVEFSDEVESIPWRFDGADQGAAFMSDARGACFEDDSIVRVHSLSGPQQLTVWMVVPGGSRLWLVDAPGPPPGVERRPFLVLESPAGAMGLFTLVYDWSGSVSAVEQRAQSLVVRRSGTSVHEHVTESHSWTVNASDDGEAPVRFVRTPQHEAAERPGRLSPDLSRDTAPLVIPRKGPGSGALYFELGERNFRRSELSWREHGQPVASVSMSADATRLFILVRVKSRSANFAAPRSSPWLDNENPDINSDGIQLHFWTAESRDAPSEAALLLVPEANGVRINARDERWRRALQECRWRAYHAGYEMDVVLDRAGFPQQGGVPFRMDVIVNLLAPGRERRSGQLVLSGAAGEWIHLAGNRQPPGRLLPFRIAAS
jgi:hypothetical protein